jgi:hypothetical protein
MQEIVASVRRVTDLIGEISAAASEQHDGFAQVNQAVSNLDQMTQHNAALVEESSAAAMSMNEQAQRLAQVVAVFNVGQAGMPSSRPLAASRPGPNVARAASAAPARLAPPPALRPQAVPLPLPGAAAKAGGHAPNQPASADAGAWEDF